MTDEHNKPGYRPLDRAAAAKHDALFSDDFVAIKGASRPISKVLAVQLGYSLQQVRWTAGSDAEDGEVADPSDEG